jgi:rod shape-determining protein MreD
VKKFPLIVVLLVFVILQAFFAHKMAFGRISPDFPLLIVLYFAVYRGAFHGSILGFIVGLIQDLFNPTHLGLNALTKTLTGYCMGLAGTKTEPDSSLFLFALFGVAALAHDFVYLLVFTGLHLGKFVVTLATVSVPSALYTAVVGILVHWLVFFVTAEAVRSIGKARY